MKKLSCLFCLAILLFLQKGFTQSCPANIDFEGGSFNGWECFTGSTFVRNGQNVMNLTPSPPTPTRHEIISASSVPAKDKYGKFPTLCPYGGNYSVKLGNENTGSQAEGLTYTFQVPSTVDTFTFTYFYAVVFQDPDHVVAEQPRFFVTAYDVESGAIINCASFDYVADGSIPGFQMSPASPSVFYKDWTPASLQFAGLQNRNVRLEFKTADCTLGGHFGYAYVDVGSGCSNILATAPYCIETNSLILNAPYGFKSYTWYNETFSTVVGTTQSITLSPPPITSGVFYVDLVPYPGFGCRDTSQARIMPLPVPDTPGGLSAFTYCQGQPGLPLTAVVTPGNDLVWYTTATGGIGSNIAPTPSTANYGTFNYYVSQKVLFGCEGFRKKITVTVIPSPVTNFTINNLRQCQNGNSFNLASKTVGLFNSVFSWNFGDGQSQSSAADSIVSHTYTVAGTFPIKLKVTNDSACTSEKTLFVTVVPKPTAAFSFPDVVCEKQTPVTIINSSFVPGGVATINQWWWNINGVTSGAHTPGAFTPNTPGPFPVKLVVTTTEGCSSDTNNTAIPVRYRPGAAFKYGTLLCDNEPISFTDLSTMPPGASQETISKWYWQIGTSVSSNLKDPTVNLVAGTHSAKLITETIYGCKSLETDSTIVINEKPHVQLYINDSCVFRTINYTATDLNTTVNKWYWNFGTGLSADRSVITKTYTREGSRPFTVLGETIYGCKDTINRPFTIYDNKAFAGRDTIAAMDEPVQLHAHGGTNVQYIWTPAIGLNDPSKENPVATHNVEQLYRLYAITDKGCDSHSKILIKRYKGPELYIPSAFTPNGDGLNDVLKVFPVGIKTFTSFSIFNRYGERMFYTEDYSKGWNGIYKGKPADAGAYVAIATAIDYRGKPMQNKLSVVIIR